MWFRRRKQQPTLDLSSLERSLDRLMELVQQIVALIPELVAAREGGSRAPPVSPRASIPAPLNPHPAPNPGPHPDAGGFVLFAGGSSGYRLLERDGSPPDCGSMLELEGEWYVVLRLGPSPLPHDRRRCVYLEREEPLRSERSPAQ
jgi:hypothetical protein